MSMNRQGFFRRIGSLSPCPDHLTYRRRVQRFLKHGLIVEPLQQGFP